MCASADGVACACAAGPSPLEHCGACGASSRWKWALHARQRHMRLRLPGGAPGVGHMRTFLKEVSVARAWQCGQLSGRGTTAAILGECGSAAAAGSGVVSWPKAARSPWCVSATSTCASTREC